MVSNSHDFGSEFSRLAILLINDGKSPEEMAALAQCDLAHVTHFLDQMVSRRYATKTGDQYTMTFPVITLKEAEEGRKVAEETADELTSLVEKNLPAYRQVMADMVSKGQLNDNADDFTHGGSVLYYTWPTVAGLFFWFDLAQDFVNPGKILSIYRGSDFCNARIPDYLYAVEGGPYYNGTLFYTLELAPHNMDIVFMDTVPDVGCIEGFEKFAKLYPGRQWGYEEGVEIEPFVIDTILINTALAGLRTGADAIMEKAINEMTAIAKSHGHSEFTVGHRLWFWNLATTRALVKIDQNGIVKRRGNGRYRFEEL
jgi:DNA-binding MarR family transcriptional regulator